MESRRINLEKYKSDKLNTIFTPMLAEVMSVMPENPAVFMRDYLNSYIT